MSFESMDFANFSNATFIEELYQRYKKEKNSVDPSWRFFFEGVELAGAIQVDGKDLAVYKLIDAYRRYGHLFSRSNPLFSQDAENALDLNDFGLSQEDMALEFSTFGLLSKPQATLQEILGVLKQTYLQTIGYEYMDTARPEIIAFIQKHIERAEPIDTHIRIALLEGITKAQAFESHLHTRYVGQKRFSLEGTESLIPLLQSVINEGAVHGAEHFVLGMAHRGRLNTLAHILDKPYEQIFYEFEDHYLPDPGTGTGDVKYHKGFASKIKTISGRDVNMTLCANPSHLESVDPIVEGVARALQTDAKQQKIIPILIHGDASLSGQGVVYETMQLSSLPGYGTGGSIHIVVNNQIGFTTLPEESRSTKYCTDIAKTFGAVVLHVSAQDPDACYSVARLAVTIRQQFAIDVFIDLMGYRKYGHNEGDEPSFTQPVLYEKIRALPGVQAIFKDKLIQEGIVTAAKVQEIEAKCKQGLDDASKKVPKTVANVSHEEYYRHEALIEKLPPACKVEDLASSAAAIASCLNDVAVHPKIARIFTDRAAACKDPSKKGIDWGLAEQLAFSSLLSEGINIRLSGQDCQRGTFSQRHAVWVDQKNQIKHFPFSKIAKGTAFFEVLNSPLSEYAVLGFEYGYSTVAEGCLTLWEAQYGDFANTAQVIIDQYLSSSQQKWGQKSHLTLLLPHGYEGQGPEHSSARIERYLQLCAQSNMTVVNCSSPAQYFHILRRQAYMQQKRPLVIFTPKALLRHPLCVSTLDELASGSFLPLIGKIEGEVTKVLFCSGKVYFDLWQEKEKRNRKDIALLAIEELYPFPLDALSSALKQCKHPIELAWVQEEHRNMGPWSYVASHMEKLLGAGSKLAYIGRPDAAVAATGSFAIHKKQLEKIMDEAFA